MRCPRPRDSRPPPPLSPPGRATGSPPLCPLQAPCAGRRASAPSPACVDLRSLELDVRSRKMERTSLSSASPCSTGRIVASASSLGSSIHVEMGTPFSSCDTPAHRHVRASMPSACALATATRRCAAGLHLTVRGEPDRQTVQAQGKGHHLQGVGDGRIVHKDNLTEIRANGRNVLQKIAVLNLAC